MEGLRAMCSLKGENRGGNPSNHLISNRIALDDEIGWMSMCSPARKLQTSLPFLVVMGAWKEALRAG
jgi:hypothetical protein